MPGGIVLYRSFRLRKKLGIGNGHHATKEQLDAHAEADDAIAKAFGERCDRIERKMDEVKAEVRGIATGIQLALGIAEKRRKDDKGKDNA